VADVNTKKKNTLNPTLGKYVPNKSSTLLAKNFRCQNFRRSMIVLLHPQGFTEYTDGKIRTILLSISSSFSIRVSSIKESGDFGAI